MGLQKNSSLLGKPVELAGLVLTLYRRPGFALMSSSPRAAGEEQAGRPDVRDQADPTEPGKQGVHEEDHAGSEAPLPPQPRERRPVRGKTTAPMVFFFFFFIIQIFYMHDQLAKAI